jgi:hypothetical protein
MNYYLKVLSIFPDLILNIGSDPSVLQTSFQSIFCNVQACPLQRNIQFPFPTQRIIQELTQSTAQELPLQDSIQAGLLSPSIVQEPPRVETFKIQKNEQVFSNLQFPPHKGFPSHRGFPFIQSNLPTLPVQGNVQSFLSHPAVRIFPKMFNYLIYFYCYRNKNRLCKNPECIHDKPVGSKCEYCSPYCKLRITNIRRAKPHTEYRLNLLRIRKTLEKYIESGVDNETFEKRRQELLEGCGRSIEHLKTRSLKKKKSK